MRDKFKTMVLNRNYDLASTLGHIINFKKDVPIEVPSMLWPEAIAIGAEPVDGSDLREQAEPEAPKQPVAPAERLAAIREAIEGMVYENRSDDFTASNTPKVAVVSERVGFKVDRTEVTKAWRDRAEELANETG